MQARLQSVVPSFVLGAVVGLALIAIVQHWSAGVHLGPWLSSHKDELAGLGVLVSSLGLLIASAGLFISAFGQRLTAVTAFWNSSRDCFWHFNDKWATLPTARRVADQFLATTSPPYAVTSTPLEEVLNFFEGMGYMANRGHLNDELAWAFYFDEANDLWDRAERYVAWQQTGVPALWREHKPWLDRLAKIELAHAKSGNAVQGPIP